MELSPPVSPKQQASFFFLANHSSPNRPHTPSFSSCTPFRKRRALRLRLRMARMELVDGGRRFEKLRRAEPLALKISALDAAQPFDYESKKLQELAKVNSLKIGIVGFGNFGQFLACRFVSQGHNVMAHSRSDYSEVARKMGVTFFRDSDDFCEEHPEVVILCTSILSAETALRSLPFQRLKRSTLFVDVLSVKEFPRNLFLQVLPPEFDVLCTHPMFGPESGGKSWNGLPFAFEKIRIGDGAREERCKKFLDIFGREGCRMVEMSCEEHDRFAAGSQFITHTVGRVLGKLGLESTPINTKGYETLLNLVDNTAGDSFDLYYGLFMYNVNATEQLEKLELAFDAIKKQLFSQLHNVLRKQLFPELGKQQNPGDELVSFYPESLKGCLPSKGDSVEREHSPSPDGMPSSNISDKKLNSEVNGNHHLQFNMGSDANLP